MTKPTSPPHPDTPTHPFTPSPTHPFTPPPPHIPLYHTPLDYHDAATKALYLADKYPEKGLAPPVGSPLRGAYYTWSVYSMVTVERAVDQVNQHTVRLPAAERVPAAAEAGRARSREAAEVVDRALDGRPYLIGDGFTAADLMMASVLGWGRLMGMLGDQPRLEDYVKRHVSRPAAKRSRAD